MQPHMQQQIEVQCTSWGQGYSPTFVVNSLPLWGNSAPLQVTSLPFHILDIVQFCSTIRNDSRREIYSRGGLASMTSCAHLYTCPFCKGTSRVVLSEFWESVLLMAQWQIVYHTPIIPDFSCLCHVVQCLLLVVLGHSVIIGWLLWCCVPDYLV